MQNKTYEHLSHKTKLFFDNNSSGRKFVTIGSLVFDETKWNAIDETGITDPLYINPPKNDVKNTFVRRVTRRYLNLLNSPAKDKFVLNLHKITLQI